MTHHRRAAFLIVSLVWAGCGGDDASPAGLTGENVAGGTGQAFAQAGQANALDQGNSEAPQSGGGTNSNVAAPPASTAGGASAAGGTSNAAGASNAGDASNAGGANTAGASNAAGGSEPGGTTGGLPNAGNGAAPGMTPAAGEVAQAGDVLDTGADPKFSFFVTSYHHIKELSGSDKGFGGDLRYKNAASGLLGADAICQEMARRVGFGAKTWKAYLSSSQENAIDRIGEGPWYDHAGKLVAEDKGGLTSGDRPAGGCCDNGTYDELGTFHDGKTDLNNDGKDDDDHDTMTATKADGTYAGFSCEDWTSVTAAPAAAEGGGRRGGGAGLANGILMGHSWPARSGTGWSESHAGHACAAGTNFVQDGRGDLSTVGGGGGYGGFYCFALAQ